MRVREGFLQISDAIDRVARFVVTAFMAIMCIVVLFGVFFRYVVGDALTWTEEAARYLMIWMGFLATGLALRQGGHVAVDSLINLLPPRGHRLAVLLVRLLSIAFLAVVVGAGAALLSRISGQITAVLGISAAWPYLAIPVGCMLTTIEMISLMIRDPDQLSHRAEDGDITLDIRS